jgi:hypothetical protein
LIEDFSKYHMKKPSVLWLSASDKKSYPQFVEFCKQVGLKFDLNETLPDLILAEMSNDLVGFIFCEVVATDGPVTEDRKRLLMEIVQSSNIPKESVKFLTAFEERNANAFRKAFSKIAVDTLVWFRTEPELLVILTKSNRNLLDPNKNIT